MTASTSTPVPPWHLHHRDRGFTCAPVSSAAYEFHRALPGYAPTRLVEAPSLADELGLGRVLVKDESDRFGLPSFKALGASWAVHRTAAGATEPATLVAATDGNHGRAVARFAFLLGHRSVVFVPTGVHPSAVDAIRAEGADVHEVDGDYDAAIAGAAELADSAGGLLVQDMAWPGYSTVPGWIVDGYHTMFVELDAQLAALGVERPDLVVVPTGVGSLLQAALTHYRCDPERAATRVASVEPDTAACVHASLIAGKPVTVATGHTAMAGLNCGTVSALAWPAIEGGLDAALLAIDADTPAAAHAMVAAGLDPGPCGAAPLAALRGARRAGVEALYAHLGLGPDATVVLLATESSSANPVPTLG